MPSRRTASPRRMGSARKEIAIGRRYQYVVVNDTGERAVATIKEIITAEHCRVDRNQHLFEELERE